VALTVTRRAAAPKPTEPEPARRDPAEVRQKIHVALDNLAIRIDDALGDAADAVLGERAVEPVAATLKKLYRQVRKIGDAQLLLEDDRYVIPSNLIGGAAFNGRQALLDGNPPYVVKQRREIADARAALAEALTK
jgi:hypothetical protein